LTGRIKLGVDVSFWLDERYSMKTVQLSEKAGFDSVWFGDHFLPWHHSFKHSFFIWPVMATAAERTRRVPIGVDVTVPIGGRYHPAIIAQAIGTLDTMYPGRIYLGVGTGEAMSEKRFMGRWPRWQERMDRLVEALELIRKLWSSDDFFDFDGRYFGMEKTFLYVKPKRRVPIYFSAIGEKAIPYAARYGDHLMTVNTLEKCKNIIFPRFDEACREAGRDPGKLEKMVLIAGGLVDVEGTIRKIRKYHAGTLLRENFDEPDPRKIEESGQRVSDQQIRESYYIFEKPEELIECIDSFRKIGTDHLVYTDFSPKPEKTIQTFAKKIIPYFKGRRGRS